MARRDAEGEIHSLNQKRSVSEKLLREKRKDLTRLTQKVTEGEKRLAALQTASEASDPEWIRISEERKRLEKRRQVTERKQKENQQRLRDWKQHVT